MVRPILHSFNFIRIHPNAILANKTTHIYNFKGSKRKFILFLEEFVLGEDIKNFIHMGDMGLRSFTIDENIIK
jgi:hypothetical protein